MGVGKGRASNPAHNGNRLLIAGSIWGLVAAFVCPCPLCVLGTLSFLGTGLWDKVRMSRRLKEVAPRVSCRCNDEKCECSAGKAETRE